MNKFNILAGLVGVMAVFTGYLFLNSQVISVGTELPQAVALFETSLAAPITSTANTMTLTSNSVRGGGILSGYNCFTIDEGSAQAEFVCGTVATTTVTGLTRGISPLDGTTEDADLKFSHRRGASVKITDFPIIQLLRSQNNGDGTFENVLRYAGSVVPTGASDLADVGYVLSVVNGGAVSFDALVVAGRAGETVATGTLVYFNSTDQEWYKVNANSTSTFQDTAIGLTQGAGTNGNSIAGGGILLRGRDDTQTGLTAGATYYASTTTGLLGITATNQPIGKADSSTVLYFDPLMIGTPKLGYNNIFTGSNTFTGTTTFTGVVSGSEQYGDGSDGNVTISTPTTLTRDMYYNNLVVTDVLTTNGYRIFVKDTISGTGTIKTPNGNSGTAGSAYTAGTGASAFTGGVGVNTAGGNGGTGDNSSSGGSDNSAAGIVGVDGYLGSSAGAPGAGTSGVNISKQKIGIEKWSTFGLLETTSSSIVKRSLPGAGGGNGSGSASAGLLGSGSGGGGASGGIVLIFARNWTGTFTISAIAGNGGAGASHGSTNLGGHGGGGGTGGVSIVVYSFKTWTGSYLLTPGTGGSAGAGTGGQIAGTAGSTGGVGLSYEIRYQDLF